MTRADREPEHRPSWVVDADDWRRFWRTAAVSAAVTAAAMVAVVCW